MKDHLGYIPAFRKTGNEIFNRNGNSIGSNLFEFWRWYASDLLENTKRGAIAEFIVALDLGVADTIQNNWKSYDLETKDGIKVEVKSSAYIQSWKQSKLSRIEFGINPTHKWDAETNETDENLKRQSDIYIFCLLATQDQSLIDPLDVDQWRFFILSTKVLNSRLSNKKTISLKALQELGPLEARYGQIGDRINEVEDNH